MKDIISEENLEKLFVLFRKCILDSQLRALERTLQCEFITQCIDLPDELDQQALEWIKNVK